MEQSLSCTLEKQNTFPGVRDRQSLQCTHKFSRSRSTVNLEKETQNKGSFQIQSSEIPTGEPAGAAWAASDESHLCSPVLHCMLYFFLRFFDLVARGFWAMLFPGPEFYTHFLGSRPKSGRKVSASTLVQLLGSLGCKWETQRCPRWSTWLNTCQRDSGRAERKWAVYVM